MKFFIYWMIIYLLLSFSNGQLFEVIGNEKNTKKSNQKSVFSDSDDQSENGLLSQLNLKENDTQKKDSIYESKRLMQSSEANKEINEHIQNSLTLKDANKEKPNSVINEDSQANHLRKLQEERRNFEMIKLKEQERIRNMRRNVEKALPPAPPMNYTPKTGNYFNNSKSPNNLIPKPITPSKSKYPQTSIQLNSHKTPNQPVNLSISTAKKHTKSRTKRDSDRTSFIETKINDLNNQFSLFRKDFQDFTKGIQQSKQNDKLSKSDDVFPNFLQLKSKIKNSKKGFPKEVKQRQGNDQEITFIEQKLNTLTNQVNNYLKSESSDQPKSHFEVKGLLNTRNLRASDAKIGSMNIKNNKLILKPNMQLVVGENVLLANELINSLTYIDLIKKRCGDDFANCKILSDEEIRIHKARDMQILSSLKNLKRDARRLLDN